MPAPDDELLVLLGGAGDLVTRHVAPALHQLEERSLLGTARIVGVDRADLDRATYRDRLATSVRQQREDADEDVLNRLLQRVDYQRAEIGADDLGAVLVGATYVHVALPPSVQLPAARALRGARTSDRLRVVVEKPYGGSGADAHDLDAALLDTVPDDRLLRADHLLHHRAVRDLEVVRRSLAGRAAQVRELRVRWDEAAPVGDRAAFFDPTGALVDMVQSHLLQLVAAVLSPPRSDRAADEVRTDRAQVLAELTGDRARRARYSGYLDHDGVDPARGTETWVGVSLRWQDRVPVALTTGKAVGGAQRRVSLLLDTGWVHLDLGGRRLAVPGLDPSPFADAEPDDGLTASAHQVLDALRGDRTRFLGSLEVAEQWRIADGVRRRWSTEGTVLEEYEPGSHGPEEEDD